MQFNSKCKVLGVAFFFGPIDGKEIDSGTIFIEEALDETTERAKGFRSVEYKCPNHLLAKALLHNTFPIIADVSFESKVTKSGTSMAIVAVKPLQLAPTQKVA